MKYYRVQMIRGNEHKSVVVKTYSTDFRVIYSIATVQAGIDWHADGYCEV